ncbi:hypothetical protein B0T26DRAFT_868728 [Lasiosphaeria miniovina]|uniref:Uncharacterized protein n=1 Tax=Lasiosphaeria miniovina TaxID=1954250 RepID=A0AA40B495_9PEZI|nr:uncharacterized protein B0T26DRAFT_868728 [Lasiosphaeria miniovina]KAK0727421.1 hypothetical protein B0T26DRAFT_868728 [Lasiosphaeria miniovina]
MAPQTSTRLLAPVETWPAMPSLSTTRLSSNLLGSKQHITARLLSPAQEQWKEVTACRAIPSEKNSMPIVLQAKPCYQKKTGATTVSTGANGARCSQQGRGSPGAQNNAEQRRADAAVPLVSTSASVEQFDWARVDWDLVAKAVDEDLARTRLEHQNEIQKEVDPDGFIDWDQAAPPTTMATVEEDSMKRHHLQEKDCRGANPTWRYAMHKRRNQGELSDCMLYTGTGTDTDSGTDSNTDSESLPAVPPLSEQAKFRPGHFSYRDLSNPGSQSEGPGIMLDTLFSDWHDDNDPSLAVTQSEGPGTMLDTIFCE